MKIKVPNINKFLDNYDKTIKEFDNLKSFIKAHMDEYGLTDNNIKELEAIDKKLKKACVLLKAYEESDKLIEFNENNHEFNKLFSKLNIERDKITEINRNLKELSDFSVKSYIKEVKKETLNSIEGDLDL